MDDSELNRRAFGETIPALMTESRPATRANHDFEFTMLLMAFERLSTALMARE